MGTRNLTLVKIDDTIKVAQYCQWDGYPEGQGQTVLQFLHSTNIGQFKEKVRLLTEATEEEITAAWKATGSNGQSATIEQSDKMKQAYPHWHRDQGADVLQQIMDSPTPLKMQLDVEFGFDSLFCEWAYLIDLDANTLEVYRGLNQDEVEGYWTTLPQPDPRSEYLAVTRIKTYYLAALPDLETFLKDLGDEE